VRFPSKHHACGYLQKTVLPPQFKELFAKAAFNEEEAKKAQSQLLETSNGTLAAIVDLTKVIIPMQEAFVKQAVSIDKQSASLDGLVALMMAQAQKNM
jgi:hypothetical protein